MGRVIMKRNGLIFTCLLAFFGLNILIYFQTTRSTSQYIGLSSGPTCNCALISRPVRYVSKISDIIRSTSPPIDKTEVETTSVTEISRKPRIPVDTTEVKTTITSKISQTIYRSVDKTEVNATPYTETSHTNQEPVETTELQTTLTTEISRKTLRPVDNGEVKHTPDTSVFDSINCKALFDNDTVEMDRAKKLLNLTKANVDQELDLVNRTSNCTTYVAKKGYITSSMTEKEANFSIAYSIIMHTDVLQAEQLLRAIYRPQNIYCIHIDLKSNLNVYKAMLSVAKCFSNVFIPEQRIKVVWGEVSTIEVELVCMRELLKRNKRWKYFINLTGQEFPLKTNRELVDILTAFNGANNLGGDHSSQWKSRFKDAGPVPHDLNPAKGPVHIVVNRAFVEFVVHDQRAKDFLNWTSRTFIPDETFFVTLNLSPSLKIPGSYKYEDFKTGAIAQEIMRFKKWWMTSTCKGPLLRNNICILNVDYLPELITARELFANKFIWNHDRLSLHCMAELINNRTEDEYNGRPSFNASWYSSLDFVVNRIQ